MNKKIINNDKNNIKYYNISSVNSDFLKNMNSENKAKLFKSIHT